MALTPVSVSDRNGASQNMVAFQDAAGNNIPAISLDTSKATFRASASGVAPGATPTDFIVVTGSATKTVRIKRIEINGGATAAGYMVCQLIRRSTAFSGGTSSAGPVAKLDTNSPAATGAVTYFTGSPTAGTSVASGLLTTQRVTTQAVATSGTPGANLILFDGRNNGQAIVLRGSSDYLGVNFGGAALVAGTVYDFMVEWEEDGS